jgi:hypothetical protein
MVSDASSVPPAEAATAVLDLLLSAADADKKAHGLDMLLNATPEMQEVGTVH